MIQRRQGLRFALEPRQIIGVIRQLWSAKIPSEPRIVV
jgi:hypothetical protein